MKIKENDLTITERDLTIQKHPIVEHFECSKFQIQEYLELIDTEELKSILEMYGLNNKTITRLCR